MCLELSTITLGILGLEYCTESTSQFSKSSVPKNIECIVIRTVLLHHSIPGGPRISTRALKTASFFHKFVYTACRLCQPWFHTIVSDTGITTQDRYVWYFDGSFLFSCYFWVQTKNRNSQDIPSTIVKHQNLDFVQKWVLVRRGLLSDLCLPAGTIARWFYRPKYK